MERPFTFKSYDVRLESRRSSLPYQDAKQGYRSRRSGSTGGGR
jgi:hypothetical protein